MRSVILLSLVVLLLSCQKQDEAVVLALDCAAFTESLLDLHGEEVAEQLDPWLAEQRRVVTDEDALGHEAVMLDLVEQMDVQCDFQSVELFCYACIETLPVQSEIVILQDSSGVSVRRVIDFYNPANDHMTVRTVHL